MRFLAALVMVMLIFALGAFAKNASKQDKIDQWGPTTINVRGEGEILAKPDIGSFSFSVMAEGADASEAQTASAEKMNAILSYLSDEGVAEEDVKTQNYNLNPKYRWEPEFCPAGGFCNRERVTDGFEVNQSVMVKVRDLDAAGDLISGVGERGATNISSLQFTIDDMDTLQAEAREAAIADAKAKAEELADDLGVRLKRIRGFYEEGGYPMPYGGDMMERAVMSMDMDDGAVAPSLPSGENTIRSTVNITYEIK